MPKNDTNVRPGEFFLGFQPYKSLCELRDHTLDAMWLGNSFPLDTSVLRPDGGDDPQYPELGLGYSKQEEDVKSQQKR